MSTISLRLSLALLVACLVANVGQSAWAVFPIDNYYAINPSTYDMWYGNRIWLGQHARSNEFAVTARNGTRGTMMYFELGQVYRVGNGRHAGETYFMNGGINEKYKSMGGIHGPAGFPIGNAFRISPTQGHCQLFQGGTITWNPQRKVFDYFPYPLGDR